MVTAAHRAPALGRDLSLLKLQHPGRSLQNPGRAAAPARRVTAATAVRSDLAAAKEGLAQACRARATPPDQVLAYLKEVEVAHKASSQVENFPAAIDGTWRLVFALPAPIPAWAYIPVVEDAVIDVAAGTIALKSWLGPFAFTFSGTASFESRLADGVADMNFSFNASCVEVFGAKFEGTREPKPKRYSFFLADDTLAAVNSSATGGKTLMCRLDKL